MIFIPRFTWLSPIQSSLRQAPRLPLVLLLVVTRKSHSPTWSAYHKLQHLTRPDHLLSFASRSTRVALRGSRGVSTIPLTIISPEHRTIFFACSEKICDFLNVNIGKDFESVAALWLANKKHLITNIVSFAVLWVLWKLRNLLCFQGVSRNGLKKVMSMTGRMLRGWLPMFKPIVQEKVEFIIQQVEHEASLAPQISWRQDSLELAQSDAQPSEVLSDVIWDQCNRPSSFGCGPG